MSFFTEVETVADEAWEDLEGSEVAKLLDNAYNAAVAELKTYGAQQIEGAVKTTAEAALGGLTTGGVDGAIAAGVAAAIPAFEAAGKAITSTTAQAVVNSVVVQLQAQTTVAATA